MPYKITRRDDITGAISYGCAPWRVNLSTFPSSDLGFHRGNFLPAGTVLFRIGGSISLEQYGFGFLLFANCSQSKNGGFQHVYYMVYMY